MTEKLGKETNKECGKKITSAMKFLGFRQQMETFPFFKITPRHSRSFAQGLGSQIDIGSTSQLWVGLCFVKQSVLGRHIYSATGPWEGANHHASSVKKNKFGHFLVVVQG